MRRVFKYKLDHVDEQVVSIPPLAKTDDFKAQFLSLDAQDDTLCLWCMVDDDQPARNVRINVLGTGQIVPPQLEQENYLGSYMLYNGTFVGHVFLSEKVSECRHENISCVGHINVWRCKDCVHEEPNVDELQTQVVTLREALKNAEKEAEKWKSEFEHLRKNSIPIFRDSQFERD